MPSYMKKGEYAAYRNWTPAYITKLMKQGRIILDESGKRVDVEATDRLLAESSDPSKQGVRNRFAAYRGESSAAPDGGVSRPANPFGPPMEPVTKFPNGFDFQEARAKRETHLANIAELDEKTIFCSTNHAGQGMLSASPAETTVWQYMFKLGEIVPEADIADNTATICRINLGSV